MVKFTSAQVGEVLQRLYNSEIDISLVSEYADGFSGEISVHQKPALKSRAPKSKAITNVVDGMAFAAARDYPASDFAKWYNKQHASVEPAAEVPVLSEN
jgi:hypothetical protein